MNLSRRSIRKWQDKTISGSCCLGSSARMLNTSESAAPYLGKLNFSEGYKLLYCIALGYPDETPNAKPRKEEKVRYIE